MIVRSVNEIVVHLESFRNIDLIYQGIYTLKVSAFEVQSNGRKVYAHPYAFTESYTLPVDASFAAGARIDNNTSCFYSKSFPVRFSEQEVDINDICSFRIEFEITESDRPRVQIEVSLYFYDHLANAKQGQSLKDQEDRVKTESKLVETRTLVLSKTRTPVHSFWPVLFSDHYFCELGMMVHSCCLDYRFRVSDIQLSEYVKLKPNERQHLLAENQKIDKKEFGVSMSVARSLGLSEEPLSNQVLVIQEVIVNQMKVAYDQLFKHYQIVSTKCLLNKDKKEDGLVASSLVLPSQDPSLLKIPTHQRLIMKYKSVYPDPLVTNILTESNFISSQLVLLWNQVLQVYKVSSKLCRCMLQHKWLATQREIWGGLIQRKVRVGKSLQAPVEVNEWVREKVFSEFRGRKVRQEMWDSGFYPDLQETPMMAEDVYMLEKHEKQQECSLEYKGIHLFVLVHGFQGTSQDMRLIKNYILFLHPQALILSSSCNEDQMDSDIDTLGSRLANEVKTYINEYCPADNLGRLSFIGYSMGGLKIRSALPLLKEYKEVMHSFITFSTPHLGLLYHSSSIVDAGLWLLNKMKHSSCLKQMSYTDSDRMEDTFMFRLSQLEGLEWFKHILLLASRQDYYAPYESARIEMCPDAMSDKKNGVLYQNMAKTLTSKIQGGRLHRMDVEFVIKERSLNSLIGRAAHIMFVDNHSLAKSVLLKFYGLFQ